MTGDLPAGLRDLDLAVVFVYSISLVLFSRLFDAKVFGTSKRVVVWLLRGFGAVLALATWLATRSAMSGVISRLVDRPLAPLAAIGVAILALGFVDLVVSRLAPSIAAAAGRVVRAGDAAESATTLGAGVVSLLLVGFVAAGLVAGSHRLASGPAVAHQVVAAPVAKTVDSALAKKVRTRATYRLPGAPLRLTFRGKRDGYIALAQGKILRFELTSDEPPKLRWSVAAEGLGQVRGIAVVGSHVFITEAISWGCPTPPTAEEGWSSCWAKSFKGVHPETAETRLINKARGRISRFDARADGTLGARRTLFDDLPLVGASHSVNAVVAGPDGSLYASLGNIEYLYTAPQKLASIRRPNLNLFGTVIRFPPDGSTIDVFAKGFRNVYGLLFGPNRQLYAVDNGGPAFSGLRAEELIAIKRGADYGFPYEGSAPPYHVRTDEALLILDTVGSVDLEWAPAAGLPPGFLSGSCSGLIYVRVDGVAGKLKAVGSPERLASFGCMSAVRATPDRDLLVADPNGRALRLLRLSR